MNVIKLSDIIYKEEYVYSTAEEGLEFDRLVISPEDIDEKCVLLLPNSKKFRDTNIGDRAPLAVICDSGAHLPWEVPTVRVNNPRLAFSTCFARYEKVNFDAMKFIGVTGTNGKTSTATFIKTVLHTLGYKVGFFGTGKIEICDKAASDAFYSMTTPDPDKMYRHIKEMEIAGCDFVVMEVSSHALALDKVAPIPFEYGVFTNLSEEHLDFHGNMEEYFTAKYKLIERSKTAVFNIDDDYARRAYEICKTRKLSVGAIRRGDIYASDVENSGLDGISYIYHKKDLSFRTNIKLPGIYNVYNAMLATTVCIDIGCRPCEVKTALNDMKYVDGRFEIIKDEITVIIDYAHTESAFYNIMKELSRIKRGGELCVVFGCGGERDRRKRPKMAKIAERYADRIILTNDNSRGEDPKDIFSDIIRGFTHKSYEICENRKEAIYSAILNADKKDIVAIIGKGAEKYNIDKSGYHTFDEKSIIQSALTKRKERSTL